MEGNWGVDTVTVRIAVDYEQCNPDPLYWSHPTESITGASVNGELHRTDVKIGGANVRVELNSVYRTAYFTFNASRVAGLPQPFLLPPEHLRLVVGFVIEQFHPVVPVFQQPGTSTASDWYPNWAKEVGLTRLDIARDFEIPLDRLPLVHSQLQHEARSRTGRARFVVNFDPKGGFSYERRTRYVGKDILYNKSAQLGLPGADPTVLRFEAQWRNKKLKDLGLAQLSNISDRAARQALLKQFTARAFGSQLVVPSHRSTLYREVPADQRHSLDSYLSGMADGDDSLFGVREKKRLRKLARSHGLRPGVPPALQGRQRGYLDLARGLWVERIDAD